MVVRDRIMQTDCTQSLRNGKIRALNGCTGRLFRARPNHKNSDIKRYKQAMTRKKGQSERNSHSKNRGGKQINRLLSTCRRGMVVRHRKMQTDRKQSLRIVP